MTERNECKNCHSHKARGFGYWYLVNNGVFCSQDCVNEFWEFERRTAAVEYEPTDTELAEHDAARYNAAEY